MIQKAIKILLDRENHLKSDLVDLKRIKLDKIIDYDKINLLEERIKELKWIKNKINKI